MRPLRVSCACGNRARRFYSALCCANQLVPGEVRGYDVGRRQTRGSLPRAIPMPIRDSSGEQEVLARLLGLASHSCHDRGALAVKAVSPTRGLAYRGTGTRNAQSRAENAPVREVVVAEACPCWSGPREARARTGEKVTPTGAPWEAGRV